MTYPFPEHGKIVVMAPEQAALAAERSPERAHRIYAHKGLEPGVAYLVDIDELAEQGITFPVDPMPLDPREP